MLNLRAELQPLVYLLISKNIRAELQAVCSAPRPPRLDSFAIVKYPLTTESAMKKIEDNNTLVSSWASMPGLHCPHAGLPLPAFIIESMTCIRCHTMRRFLLWTGAPTSDRSRTLWASFMTSRPQRSTPS